MSKLTKPDYSIRWAQTGVVTPPDDTKKQTGWVVEKPAYDYMNWLQLRQDTGIAYMFQMGIPEWDSTTEYQYDTTYKSYVQKGGIVYKAIATNTNKDPATQTAYWTRAFDDYGVAATVQTNLSAHITNYGTLASLSNVATARSNLSVYSKSETDAKYALLAGSGSQTFSVATATAGGHAVNKTQMDAAILAAGAGDATEAAKGVLKLATQSLTDARTDDGTAVTPKKLGNGFAISLGSTGYIKLPSWLGGLMIQWGVTSTITAVSSASQTFSAEFPSACYVVVSTPISVGGTEQSHDYVSNITKVGFTQTNGASTNCAYNWIAIGS